MSFASAAAADELIEGLRSPRSLLHMLRSQSGTLRRVRMPRKMIDIGGVADMGGWAPVTALMTPSRH